MAEYRESYRERSENRFGINLRMKCGVYSRAQHGKEREIYTASCVSRKPMSLLFKSVCVTVYVHIIVY